MKDSYVISVDVGTQSLRVCLMTEKGKSIEYVALQYEDLYIKNDGPYREVQPLYYLDYLKSGIKQITSKHPDKVNSIIAISIVTIRDTIVFLENKGTKTDPKFEPLYNIIHWTDGRAASEKFCKFPLWFSASLKVIGFYSVVKRIATLGRTNWMREKRPDIWGKTDMVALLSAYMNYLITGNLVETRACLLGHLPFNTKRGEWDKKGSIHDLVFPDVVGKLPPLINQNESVGVILDDLADEVGLPHNIKVYSPGTDKALEQVGQGAIEMTDVSISFGSAASVELLSDHYYEGESFIPVYRSALPNLYTPDYQVYRGYWMLKWFAKEFAFEYEWNTATQNGSNIEAELDRLLEITPVCNDGLYMLPFWGEGIKTVGARGAIIGFNDKHTRAHIYRAIIEGINFELYDGYLRLLRRGHLPSPIKGYVSGGGASSEKICQMTADLFNLPIKRCTFQDASILGASIAAFVYEGVYSSFDDAVKNMVETKDTFIPNKANHKTYMDFYNNVYKKTLDKLYSKFLYIDKIQKQE